MQNENDGIKVYLQLTAKNGLISYKEIVNFLFR